MSYTVLFNIEQESYPSTYPVVYLRWVCATVWPYIRT